MRRLLLPLLLAVSLSAWADGAAKRPDNLQPLPEVPPPPAGVSLDQELEPQVTITKKGEDKVEEFRINGRLYMIKVTPRHGVPYYLLDEDGKGVWARRDNLGPSVQPPMWVIRTWE